MFSASKMLTVALVCVPLLNTGCAALSDDFHPRRPFKFNVNPDTHYPSQEFSQHLTDPGMRLVSRNSN